MIVSVPEPAVKVPLFVILLPLPQLRVNTTVALFPKGKLVPLAIVKVESLPLHPAALLIVTELKVTPEASIEALAAYVPFILRVTPEEGNVDELLITKLPPILKVGFEAVVKVAPELLVSEPLNVKVLRPVAVNVEEFVMLASDRELKLLPLVVLLLTKVPAPIVRPVAELRSSVPALVKF